MDVPPIPERKRQEIEHWQKLLPSVDNLWWPESRSGQRRLENRFRKLRLFFGHPSSGDLLELGCGSGLWTAFLSRLPLRISSVDLSEDLLVRARQRVQTDSVTFRAGDAENLPYAAATFDFVCGLSVLHHLDVPQALREIVRVSKPGARMWFSEPNMLNPQIMLQKNIRVLKRLAGDTPHETAFFRWAMSQALRGAGLTDVRVMPFDFMHPWIPDWATNVVDALGRMVEHIPGVREFAGSLVIHARKPL